MAIFDMTNLTGGSTPRLGLTPFIGPAISGLFAYQRNVIQFMTGSSICDYASLTTVASISAGKVLCFDTRAGGNMEDGASPTSGSSPDVPQTWTMTFTSDTTYSVSGSVSGAQGTGTCDVDFQVTDLVYVHISAGIVGGEWEVGDTITIDTLANPNTTDHWVDPEPANRYIASGGELPTKGIQGAGTTHHVGFSPLYSDAGGVSDPKDYVYFGLGTYQDHSNASYIYDNLYLRGFTGYSETGQHPNPSQGRFMGFLGEVEISGYIICDQFRLTMVPYYDGGWNIGHMGLIDSFRTSDEYAYPFSLYANYNSPIAHGNSSGGSLLTAPSGNYGEFFTEGGTWMTSRCYTTSNHTRSPDQGLGLMGPCSSVYNSNSYVGNSYGWTVDLRAPRDGDGQIPLFPITLSNWYNTYYSASYTSSGTCTWNSVNNGWRDCRFGGHVRGIFCIGVGNITEGDSAEVDGVEYLCFRGHYQNDATSERFFRLAIKLA